MPKIARRLVIGAVSTGLAVTSWVCLGLFALGDRYLSKIPRTRRDGDYV